VRPADASLQVAAGRGRSSSGFSARFTLWRETGEKRIERDVQGVRWVISNLDGIFLFICREEWERRKGKPPKCPPQSPQRQRAD
jgi:hypothetical protein